MASTTPEVSLEIAFTEYLVKFSGVAPGKGLWVEKGNWLKRLKGGVKEGRKIKTRWGNSQRWRRARQKQFEKNRSWIGDMVWFCLQGAGHYTPMGIGGGRNQNEPTDPTGDAYTLNVCILSWDQKT